MSSFLFIRCALGIGSAALLAACGWHATPLSPSPAGVRVERTQTPAAYDVLYNFAGPPKDGAIPDAGLISVNGTLYGTTAYGGSRTNCPPSGGGCGTVYSISTSGKETVLHSFEGGSADGAHPMARLLNVNGTLYGTTAEGGAMGDGIVYAISTSGKETVLYSFQGAPADGAHPMARLLNVNGTLYGTTWAGGLRSRCGSSGCGTVFSITTSGKETVLHRFKGGKTDGQNPMAGLVNVDGTLYGTTDAGGANCASGVACGTVFSITPSGKEAVRYSFKGGQTDGQNPKAGLIFVKGKLYGTTTGGGAYCRSSQGCGAVFAITPSGAETVLHSFGKGDDGADPRASLINVKGTLYGTTPYGGPNYPPGGTVFKAFTSGKERVVHNFGGRSDGDEPLAGLIDFKGTLYGTTSIGGSGYCFSGDDEGCGIIFALKP